MADINALNCLQGGANVGIGSCIRDPQKIKYIIFGRLGKQYTATQMLNAKSTLQADAVNDDPLERIYIVPVTVNEDQSSDAERFTYPDGSTKVTRDPIYRIQFEHRGGVCLHTQLLNGFNQMHGQFGYMFADSNYTIQSENVTDSNGTITGIKFSRLSEIYIPPYTMATESDPTRYYIELQIEDIRSRNQNGAYVDLDFPLSDIDMIQTANLGLIAWVSGAAGTVNISAVTGCGGQNLATLYSTALPDVTNFVATNYDTGNVIPITAVTKVTVSGKDALLFDFDSADPDYPTAGNNLILAGAAPSVLSGNDVEWYEIPRIILTRPA